jgi:hypothetical protein
MTHPLPHLTTKTPLTSVARSPKDGTLRAPPNDAAAGLKSPQTPSVAPSPISSDVGTEFADTDEAVDEAASAAAPVRVETKLYDLGQKEADVQENVPFRSAIDRIRSPALKVSPLRWERNHDADSDRSILAQSLRSSRRRASPSPSYTSHPALASS